jgi:hypothetical protein
MNIYYQVGKYVLGFVPRMRSTILKTVHKFHSSATSPLLRIIVPTKILRNMKIYN